MKEDAQKNAGILALRTQADIHKYATTKTASRTPVEDLLYQLIRQDYHKAEELLRQSGDTIPEYLRLLLKADLASEGAEPHGRTSDLVKFYQDAFDAQTSDINRSLIKFRIRQVRYGQ